MNKDRILLILGTTREDYGGITIGKIGRGRDVRGRDDAAVREERLAAEAIRYAKAFSRKVVVLQILHSDLYHYGYNDIILPAPSKTRFLSYVRDAVTERGERAAASLREVAKEQGVSLEIKTVESDDPPSAVLEEAKKGYDMIFLPKERRHLFPLLRKTAEQVLRKEGYEYTVTG
ncbi:MAG: universal stress protein [Deltaproteobacteria bacterium]|nr:universal stress protein [Deltaproteobacteria bacterium]